MSTKAPCTLCGHQAEPFFEDSRNRFLLCPNCQGIFRDPEQWLPPQSERERYLLHRNHTGDLGYLQFAEPILSAVRKRQKKGEEGLDFGCGHTPVISEILKRENYSVAEYDPFFFDDKNVLNKTYDYIVCCEVIEHFHAPAKEFSLLHDLLRPAGRLLCMTYIYHPGMDFAGWFYKNDLTHVFLYQKETLLWIAEHLGFEDVQIKDRLAIFTK